MQYPDDATLIARGKLSTVNREKRAQIERVQTIAKTIMHKANPLLEDCQEKPPADAEPVTTLQTCVTNAALARLKIIELCAEAAVLEPIAWPK